MKESAKDYNLAWVGSDDAICHVGTGLHKVPLARLQDVFLTIGRGGSGESKTVRLMEVISILGPFPNVRNTLQGSVVDIKSMEDGMMGTTTTTTSTSATNTRGVAKKDTIRIMYDSMMDGLGKEINAGRDDNLRYVDLEIVFCDEKALVCVVPRISSNGNGDDNDANGDVVDFGENGKNVLLFLKEDDLDLKLEGLRAA